MDTEETTQEASNASPTMDLGQLEDYLLKICPLLLDAETASFEAALKAPATQDKLKKFASDSKVPALLVRKRISESADEETTGGIYLPIHFLFVYTCEISYWR